MTSLEWNHPVIVPVLHEIRVIKFFYIGKTLFKAIRNPASFEGYKSEKAKFIPPFAQIGIGFISVSIRKKKIRF